MRGFTALLVFAVVGGGLCGALGFAEAKSQATFGTSGVRQSVNDKKTGVVLVSDQKQIWISCRVAKPHQALPEGFCDRLIAGLVQATGQQVGTTLVVPEGETTVIVEVDQTNAQGAGVTLRVGRAENGTFVQSQRQEVRLRTTDAPLLAGSAQALVYPIVSLLKAAP